MTDPTTPLTPQQEIHRANEARQIIDSQVFKDAKSHIEGKLAGLRRTVPLSETEMHTKLILMEQLWGHLSGYFDQLIVSGKFAELKLEEERRRQTLKEQAVAMFGKLGRGAF